MESPNLEVIAPTVEEAIEQGLSQLGLSQDAVEVEVIDAGSKGFLGLGGRQVRVRLTVKETQQPAQVKTAPEPVAPVAAPVTHKSESADDATDPIVEFTRNTVSELLSRMKVDASVSARYGEDEGDERLPILVDIHGKDLSILIGRRAETLSALQYIVGLIVSKEAGHWVQVTIDVEGYRGRRERQIRQLARRMAEQAVRSGRKQMLEPMSSSERRLVHLELRNHPEVETMSVGEEPNRKVTIVLK